MPARLLHTPLGVFYGSMLLTLKSMDSNLASHRKGDCLQKLLQTLSATISRISQWWLWKVTYSTESETGALNFPRNIPPKPIGPLCPLSASWSVYDFLSTVSFIDLLKVIPRHDMNVIRCKQIVLIDMVHQQSHGKSRRVRGGYHITVDTSVPKSHFHWKIPIYKYCQVLKCQSYFYH